MKFGFDWPSGFWRRRSLKMVDGRTTDDNGQRTDDGACLYYKLTNEPKGSGELKITLHSNRHCVLTSTKHLKFAITCNQTLHAIRVL